MAEILKLIQFRAAYNLPVHAGQEFGFFARYGLELEITYTPGSRYVCQALKDGRCDVGHTGADDIIADIECDNGSDLFIFMGLHSGLFSLVSSSDCTSIDSLRGRTVGVDAKTSGFALVLERTLRSRGFANRDYQPIEIGGWERRYTALLEGRISATLLTEPFVMNALAAGCHLLARDSDMIPSYQGTCGAASRRWAAQHPDRLTAYIQAYVEATQWCFDGKNRASCLDILTRYHEVGGRAAERTLDSLLDPAHGLYPKAGLNTSGIAGALALRAELGYLEGTTPAVEKYVDLAYYCSALLSDQ